MSDETNPPKPLVFTDRKVTTRRKYELMRINEVDAIMKVMFREIDECMDMVKDQHLVPDGECEVVISVRQTMKVEK